MNEILLSFGEELYSPNLKCLITQMSNISRDV